MSIFVSSPGRAPGARAGFAYDTESVTLAIAVLTVFAIMLLAAAPFALFFPAIALIATVLAVFTGLVGYLGEAGRRPQTLSMASIFAFAAAAAGIMGDPMRVAQLIR